MDQELFIIELISAKDKILSAINNRTKKMILKIGLYLVVDFLFFYGLATLIYTQLQQRIIRTYVVARVADLYHLSIIVGAIVAVILLLLAVFLVLRKFNISRNFDAWIEKHVTGILTNKVIAQDARFIYLSQENQKELALVKKNCRFLMQSLDGSSLFLGEQLNWNGTIRYYFFRQINEPEKRSTKKRGNPLFNQLAIGVGLLLLGFGSGYLYISGGTNNDMARPMTETHKPVSNLTQLTNSEGLLNDPKKTVTLTTSQTNDLVIEPNSQLLYLTTNAGKDWQFVPLKQEWIRFGDYTLTTGAIANGDWMDKTYDISADFSWFIYSPDKENSYFLSSSDNGKTWQKSKISGGSQRVRYRKVNFFANQQGVAVFSSNSGMSSESLQIYTTNDRGQTWQEMGGTIINQPIQNASFVTTSLGFVATRNNLYYTNDAGRTFKESLVVIPSDYQTDGLDLFQSPNEAVQVSANRLEAKFYLLKNGPIDAGKMFACLFYSTDNGETWQFEQQLSQVENN